jgi:hypothetical protein
MRAMPPTLPVVLQLQSDCHQATEGSTVGIGRSEAARDQHESCEKGFGSNIKQ